MAERIDTVLLKGVTLSLFVSFFFASSTHAATISVNTTAFSGLPSDCTFSDAVTAANTNSAVNGCVAGDAEPTIDAINLPSGTLVLGSGYTLSESVDIYGTGMGTSTLSGFDIYTDTAPVSIAHIGFHALTMNIGTLNIYNPLDEFTLDHVELDSVSVYTQSDVDGLPLRLNFTNISAINDTTFKINQSSSDPGDVLIENSVLTGTASGTAAITYQNTQRNARLTIRNSVITGYTTGIVNHECTNMVWSPDSIYISDSMIGGGGMQTGIVNECGHLVVSRTTFHDITGAAIMAWANYQSVDQNSGICEVQSNSRLEVYNSTFTRITVDGSYATSYPLAISPFRDDLITPFIGILTVDSQLNPTCPSASQVTDTDITLVHNTFANNTFSAPGSAIVSLRNGTVLRNFLVRNNAIEGNAFTGSFSASGAVGVSGNVTTEAYTGPGAFASGFVVVADFLLGPLQDNGGAFVGIDLAGGRVLTMRPLAGSALIDAASSAGLADDQRGSTRSLMARYDAGAVEVTLAEFTADGGVYIPETTTTPPRLAETGSNFELLMQLSSGLMLGGAILTVVVFLKK